MHTSVITSPLRNLASAFLTFILLIGSAPVRANEIHGIDAAPPAQLMSAEKNSAIPTKVAATIRDNQGRTRYIVELVNDQTGKPDKFKDKESFKKWHDDNASKLIGDATKLRGVELISSTSFLGVTFTAYLTEKQYDQFAKDKRVSRITPDAYLRPSAAWSNTNDSPYPWVPGQTRSWGLHAMGISGGGSNGTATVYVLDGGIALHSDLPGLSAANQIAALPDISPVPPCYPHGAHVAGIIGAGDNGFGTVGVLPGVRLVSIAIGNISTDGCTVPDSSLPSITSVAKALEIVFWHVLFTGKVGILNLSFNADYDPRTGVRAFAQGELLWQWLTFVSAPATFFEWLSYPGVLIVQSAGNQNSDACNVAYAGGSGSILVVGGLDENGQRVRPLAGAQNAYRNQPLAGNEPGSNYNLNGNCVNLWAPSQRIISTWGGMDMPTFQAPQWRPPMWRASLRVYSKLIQESRIPTIWLQQSMHAPCRYWGQI